MRHIGLFEGIGGFSLAARWMGWETVAWCEWNEFGQKVLRHHFPEAKGHGDITKTDFTIYRGQCDILTGGFPCQPYSLAGKRLGKEDERHLWPEMLRAIREIQPRWVVGENVFGLINWSGGLVFHEVQTDLEAAGYEVFPYVLPAGAVNAPHRRDRVWFIAYNHSIVWGKGRESKSREQSRYGESHEGCNTKTNWINPHPHSNGQHGSNSEHEINASEGGEYALNDFEQADPENTNGCGCLHGELEKGESEKRGFWNTCTGVNERICSETGASTNTHSRRQPRKEYWQTQPGQPTKKSVPNNWSNFPTQPPICSGDDGLPTELDGITFPKWRNESIKAYGNAIVPQVAFEIFKAIDEYERVTF